MANKKINFSWQKKVKPLEKSHDYIILMGERADGKSYITKRIAVQSAIDSKGEEQFIYLRRFESDCKDSLCVSYFADLPIYEMTGGKYDCIDVFRKGVYLANIDHESGRITNRYRIGYCHALSIGERYKSLMFPKVQRIIYEEFISQNGNYLGQKEPDLLMQYVSTIFRHRKGKVYLVGNTISRICPYFRKWELTGIINQKLGTIEDYKFTDGDSVTRLCVYLTDSLEHNSGMFFGNVAKNITRGAYETEEQAHLPESEKHYNEIYKCVLKFEDFLFLCKFLQHKTKTDRFTWYVIPKTDKEIKKSTRVISPEYSDNIYWTTDFIGLNSQEESLFKFMDQGKIAFSDNLTGTEFYNIYNNQL